MDYFTRPVTQQDELFLWQILYEAAHMAEEGNLTMEDGMNHPNLAKYVKNWGLKDDIGFIAILKSNNQPVGAAWLRLLMSENKGYGYFNDQTPELAIGILPQYRNHGIGTQLLTHLLAAAKTFYSSVSLSIRATNPALGLYKRLGFELVAGSETINRVGGISFKMKIDFY